MLGIIELTNDQQMHSWGWRIPFLVAGTLGLIGIYLRSKMEDTPVFREMAEQEEHQHSHRGMVSTIKELFTTQSNGQTMLDTGAICLACCCGSISSVELHPGLLISLFTETLLIPNHRRRG